MVDSNKWSKELLEGWEGGGPGGYEPGMVVQVLNICNIHYREERIEDS